MSICIQTHTNTSAFVRKNISPVNHNQLLQKQTLVHCRAQTAAQAKEQAFRTGDMEKFKKSKGPLLFLLDESSDHPSLQKDDPFCTNKPYFPNQLNGVHCRFKRPMAHQVPNL